MLASSPEMAKSIHSQDVVQPLVTTYLGATRRRYPSFLRDCACKLARDGNGIDDSISQDTIRPH